ncbi:LytR/AlgR family response regulator transcription factor [Pedobacter rhodius]|uniref:LytTR family DNA-binding domain-containing protein n=1 Tax=Pedobacter rhodius TaxID=3004098 RepID=A0ABT4KUS7_9SPHI|nr:LytTR family DNA-binding domain-containing protein [Pedobacter sp. SJ11]MCZ4222520.1 LytTR family DNA-binding domain-containing protein [Pedobacter sp. SJ11]
MIINCIAIDDQPDCLDAISDYIGNMPVLNLVKHYQDPLVALCEISKGEVVDLIFMDIEMPGISGIDLCAALRHKTRKLVFTTAHSHYATQAYELHADGFLHKPFSFSKFSKLIEKLFLEGVNVQIPMKVQKPDKFFFVKNREDKNKLTKVKFDEIIAIESQGNYVKIFTETATVITYILFDEVKNLLIRQPGFIQIHRTFVISVDSIKTIGGDIITLDNDILVKVGKSYKKELNDFIELYTIKTGRTRDSKIIKEIDNEPYLENSNALKRA